MTILPSKITAQKAQLSNGDVLTLPCNVNYIYLQTDAEAQLAADILLPQVQDPNAMIAVDIETSGFDPMGAEILLLQIGNMEDLQYVFDMRKVSPEIIKPLLIAPCWKIGQNLKFEGTFFKQKWNIDFSHMFDTMLAEMIIRGGSGGRRGYGLDQILSKRLGLDMTLTRRNLAGVLVQANEQDTDRAKKVMQLSFTTMLPGEDFSPAQLAYAASDVSSKMIIQLAIWQMGRLMEPGTNILHDPMASYVEDLEIQKDYETLFPRALTMWDTACLEFKFLEVVVDLELCGIGFDTVLHEKVLTNIEKDYEEYRSAFLDQMSDGVLQTTLFGTAAINPDSPKQVQSSLAEVGIKLESTGADQLAEILRDMKEGTKKYDIVSSLMGYRKSAKLISTYGVKLMKKIHASTGRLHYRVQQILDTGRISTSNPNLQNIPARISWKKAESEEGNDEIGGRAGIRECFVPKEGYEFLIFDYSAQEMRIAAHITRDKGLHTAFKEERDLHSHSASLMYSVDYDQLNKCAKSDDKESREKNGVSLEQYKEAKVQREAGKTMNFASLYGSGARNLAEKLHLSMEQAQELQDLYWSAYPQVKEAMDRYGKMAADYGYSNTILGRRRYYTDFLDRIKWIYACPTPSDLTSKVLEFKMDWVLESGPITEKNLSKVKAKVKKKLEGDIKRQAGNHHVQGSAADMTKLAAINLRAKLLERDLDAFLVGLVHDELIVECKVEVLEEVGVLVEKCMIESQLHFCPTVPPGADGGRSAHWKK